MDAALVAVVIVLFAKLGMNLALDIRGPEAFRDPGGWKLPFGEVFVLVFSLLPLFLVAFLFNLVHGQ